MTLTRTLRIFIPFALGYFISYLFRVVNAVISTDLIRDLNLSAGDLGLLTSAYFLAFAFFQLPLGIILDRYGPRRIEAALLLAAMLGALIFGLAQSLFALIAGRALIGLGVSACLMAAFKAYVEWFPKERLPLINGLQLTIGGMGALAGTVPVELALNVTSWRVIFIGLAGITGLIALIVYIVVPRRTAPVTPVSLGVLVYGIQRIFSSWDFWKVAPTTVMSQAALLSIQGLWAGPWLRDVAGLDRTAAAGVLLLMGASIVAGFLIIGTLTDYLSRRGIRPHTVSLCGITLFALVQLAIVLEITPQVRVLWMLFGFLGTSGVISYAVLSQAFAPELAGRVNTCLNFLVFVMAFAAQWGIGLVINLWPSSMEGQYQARGYQMAFGLMLMLQLLGLLWWLAIPLFKRNKRVATGTNPP